tara:strand:+ start:1430 stop:1708 length:279 start_codon:yes stop_codon:yes gene_type:complete
MAFKGVLPSDLWDKYDREDGFDRLMLDIEVANEINTKINEATNSSSKPTANDANAMVARRNQKRKEYLSNNSDFFSAVEKAGMTAKDLSGDD